MQKKDRKIFHITVLLPLFLNKEKQTVLIIRLIIIIEARVEYLLK